MYSKQLKEEAEKEFSEESPICAKNTFGQYLSRASLDAESKITSAKHEGKKGYYLLKKSLVVSSGEDSIGKGRETNKLIKKEILLYPILVSWLTAQGYQSKDISLKRSLGKWGNPDVAGIQVEDNLGMKSIEVLTIEAKISIDNWEQWIFEAVSHRRFANRVYFAFAHPEETIEKIPSEMRYYAELYNIGILILSMENETFKEFQSGNFRKEFDDSNITIIEKFTAPYNYVQPKYILQFCRALNINDSKQLYTWGEDSN